jgi:hypothetical protein
MGGYSFPQQRLTLAQKRKNKDAWGKGMVDEIDKYDSLSFEGRSDWERKRANYDLFNGKLSKNDFEYVCRPYGEGVGEMPAEMRHYDIMSSKLRVLFGEEIKRPFNFKVVCTNPDAITEKEEEKKQLLQQYMTEKIQQKVQQEMQAQGLGDQPTESMDPEEAQMMAQQAQEIQKAMTPPQIEEYMQRSYQSSREIMGNQILTYLKKAKRLREKFNKGWKHALIAGEEIYWTGIVNGEPDVRVVNPLYFEYDKDPDIDYIQDGQWAKYVMRMTAGSVADVFGEYLTEEEIKELYTDGSSVGRSHPLGSPEFNYDYSNNLFDSNSPFEWDGDSTPDGSSRYIKVVHCEWKSLRKIGFLKYLDDEFQEQESIVDETYKLNKEAGDLSIKWEWVPEVWEGTKIGTDMYVNIRPKPNQFKDLDNLHSCKLGYVGVAYNNLNAAPVSMIDRMKPYQYLYNIIMYRLELDLASDKGKKFLADVNQIPSSMGIDMEKWLYYFDAMGMAFINPNEEGQRNKQSNFNQWQAVDLSMAQTIQQKIGLLEYLESQCSEVSGVTKQREGQVSANELVGNTQQAVVQSSHITEEWFYSHNQLKASLLEAIIDTTKVAWADSEPKKIQYVLDDMTTKLLYVEPPQLTESSFGIFVSDSAKDQELFLTMKQLAHAALQNQQAELSDVIKMLTSESSSEIKTLLEKAENNRRQREAQMQQQAQQVQMQQQQVELQKLQAQQQMEAEKLQLDKYKVDEDNRTKVEVAEINSFKGQMDQDSNDNGVPDQLEIEKLRAQVNFNDKKVDLENRKLDIKEKEVQSKETMEDKKRQQEKEEKAKDRKAKKKD